MAPVLLHATPLRLGPGRPGATGDLETDMKIPISTIVVGERHRKDLGDLKGLAKSIAAIGLLQPIGIAPDNRLIFGERRLRACRDILGLTEIEARVIDMPSIVVGENAENEVRKDFTPSERVAIAMAIADEIGNRQGQRTDKELVQEIAEVPVDHELPQEIAEVERGQETRDFAARKAGFGNRETFRQAQNVVEHAEPEVVAAMDEGKLSILAAHRATKLPAEQQREVAKTGRTFADAERENDKFRRSLVANDPPDLKVCTIVDAVIDFAGTGMRADEFRRLATTTHMARFKRHMLPVYAFLKEFVEVDNDQSRAG